jgi:hypothetical protein
MKIFNQKITVLIVFYLFTLHFSIKSQTKEKISFNSANPFAMSDVIYNLQNQRKTNSIWSANYTNRFFKK